MSISNSILFSNDKSAAQATQWKILCKVHSKFVLKYFLHKPNLKIMLNQQITHLTWFSSNAMLNTLKKLENMLIQNGCIMTDNNLVLDLTWNIYLLFAKPCDGNCDFENN